MHLQPAKPGTGGTAAILPTPVPAAFQIAVSLRPTKLSYINSQDRKTLEKSLNVLKPGGKLISISGPPDVPFAKALNLNLFLRFLMGMLSRGVLKKAKARGIAYSFLFMHAEGSQLAQIARLIESGVIRPIVDKIFPFDQTPDALAYVETGREGKVVISVAD